MATVVHRRLKSISTDNYALFDSGNDRLLKAMRSLKVTIVASLQFASALLATSVGYFVMVPRYGKWGIAFTSVAVALGLYWAVVIAFRRRPKRCGDQRGTR